MASEPPLADPGCNSDQKEDQTQEHQDVAEGDVRVKSVTERVLVDDHSFTIFELAGCEERA